MKQRIPLNPTLVGLFAVVAWGIAVPLVRIFVERMGLITYLGIMFVSVGLLGLVANYFRRGRPLNKQIFRNPILYFRWIFFVLYFCCLYTAISIVQKQNVPFVILMNYLWPTAVIFCSIFLANVRVSKWWALLTGSAIVLIGLSLEILGPRGFHEVLANPQDGIAYLLAFIGAILWGLCSALSRRGGDAAGGSMVIPFFQLTLALALPISMLPGVGQWQNLTGWWPLWIGVYCAIQFLAYQSWDFGMRRGNIVILSLCADFIPWLSLLAAHLFLHVEIGQRTILAAILLVTGAIITRYGTKQQAETFAEIE
jgi:drug/metabolite transporter (DMT)-like permease